MNISDAGLGMIEHFEGFVPHAYLDKVKVWTIGIGDTMFGGRAVQAGDVITHTDAQARLRARVAAQYAPAVMHAVGAAGLASLTQAQFDALCSFTYNEGVGAIASSTLAKCIARGDLDAAAAEFPHWNKDRSGPGGTLVEDPVLTARRKVERACFEHGVYP